MRAKEKNAAAAHRGLGVAVVIATLAAFGQVAHAEPSILNFDYRSDAYRSREKSARRWPGHCTVLLIARHPAKLRPLFVYGRNREGNLKVAFDNMGGLSPDHLITATGRALIALDRFSVTRGLDAPRIAATDWVMADPHPEILVAITGLQDWRPRDKLLPTLLSLTRAFDPDSMETLRPAFDVTLNGEITVAGRRLPFARSGRVVLSESDVCFALTLDFVLTCKGRELGLGGDDAEADLSFYITSTSYSDPPSSHQRPDLQRASGKPGVKTPEPDNAIEFKLD